MARYLQPWTSSENPVRPLPGEPLDAPPFQNTIKTRHRWTSAGCLCIALVALGCADGGPRFTPPGEAGSEHSPEDDPRDGEGPSHSDRATDDAGTAPLPYADGSIEDDAGPDVDPQWSERELIAAGVDVEGRPVLGTLDVRTWQFRTTVVLDRPVGPIAVDPLGPIYALTGSGIVRIDPETGTTTPAINTDGIRSPKGLAFDTRRRVFHTLSSVGDSHSVRSVSLGGEYDSRPTKVNPGRQLGMYHGGAADVLRGLNVSVGGLSTPPPTAFSIDLAGTYDGRLTPVELETSLMRPGFAEIDDTTYFLGTFPPTPEQWVERYCRRAMNAVVGIPAELPFTGRYVDRYSLEDFSMSSSADGPMLIGYGSGGVASAERRTLRVDTNHDEDIVCILTGHEQLDIVVPAAARFKALVIANSRPSVTLTIEDGFAPSPSATITAFSGNDLVGYTGTPVDPAFDAERVRVVEHQVWSDAGLGEADYDPTTFVSPVAGIFDWDSRTAETNNIDGLSATSGLARAPCCTGLRPWPSCDEQGRVVQHVGWCTPDGDCESSLEVVDDCNDRQAHPVVQACSADGHIEQVPTCVERPHHASCDFVDSVVDACEGASFCEPRSNGSYRHTSSERCGTSDGTTACETTTTDCEDRAPSCSDARLTTYETGCSDIGGCTLEPTTEPCPNTNSRCTANPTLSHSKFSPACADQTSCGPPNETVTHCERQMCVGNAWVTYDTPTCDPELGCGGAEVSREACGSSDPPRCVDSINIERTVCTCVPGIGCQCERVVDPCPDRFNACVGSGNTLRTYTPYCDEETNTCSHWTPDRFCTRGCRRTAGTHDTCR